MIQETTKWQLWLILAVMGPTLHGCRSVRAMFPMATMPTPQSVDGQSDPVTQDRLSANLTSQSGAPPMWMADGSPQSQSSSVVAADGGSQASDTADNLAELNTVAASTAEKSVDNTVFALDAFPEVENPAAADSSNLQSFDGSARTPAMSSMPAPLAGQISAAEKPVPRLVVSGIRPGQGEVRIAVFTSAQGFPQPSGASQVFTLQSATASLDLPLQQEPPFAVAVYQDINGDGQLSKNRFGIPVEPFAFSNNAMGHRGPPDFDEAKVPVPQPASTPLIIPISLP
jgi:uncharacterized protein (DUF2141 family)